MCPESYARGDRTFIRARTNESTMSRFAGCRLPALPALRLAMCDSCGAHARNLLTCVQCKLARYCDAECQRHAWLAHHGKVCASLAKNPPRGRSDAWVPEPFAAATRQLNLRNIPYPKYLGMIETHAAPDPTAPAKRTSAMILSCPPTSALFAAICASKCTTTFVAAVAAIFLATTNSALNTYSVVPWRYIQAAPEVTWTRDPADNATSPLTAILHCVTPGTEPGTAVMAVEIMGGTYCRDDIVVRVEVDACACCLSDMVLAPILNRKSCLVHHVIDAARPDVLMPAHADVSRIEFIGRERVLADVFMATEFVDFSASATPCVCMQTRATAARLAGPHGATVILGCVRLTLSSGDILDVLALGTNKIECVDWCSVNLRVRGPYLALDATL